MAKLSPAIRDALVLVAVFALLLGGLYVYTGTWPPAVIVESGSMMHKECAGGLAPPNCDAGVTYGRIGTIDPGDLVLVKHVSGVDDIMTQVESGPTRYGKSGDVIVYYPGDFRERTPIIHRAVAYIETDDSTGSRQYYVRWSDDGDCVGGAVKVAHKAFNGSAEHSWCAYDSRGVYIPDIPVASFGSTPDRPKPYVPASSGFLTKGDNPVTNTQTDQLSGLSHLRNGTPAPVDITWIQGKSRGELPWLGLIKLSLAGRPNEVNAPKEWTKIGSAYAPKDLWVMLGISLFVLVGVPLIYDGYKAIQNRRGKGKNAVPHTPLNVSGTGTGPTTISLTWTPPSTGPPPASYNVYRGTNRVGTSAEPLFTETGLEPGVSYLYTVSAVDANGVEGPRSPMVSVATAPPAPANPGT
jgi:signal peptidase I